MPNDNYPPKPKAKPQRPLTPQELELASGFTKRWNQSQLGLIWLKKMPEGATLADLQMFIYACEARDLDPLLSEIYARLQYDKDSGEMRLLLLDSIHGMLKLADQTSELNGIETAYETDEAGNLISATTTVHRKNCQFPFKATAYVSEYDAHTFIWNTKKRVMIAKCSLALALRLAFAAALAGVYIAEEFERDDNQPPEDTNFAIGEIIETEPEPPSEPVQKPRLDPDVEETAPSEMTMEFILNGPPLTPHTPPAAAPAPPEQEKEIVPDAPPMPVNQDFKEKNRAYKQRILKDLEISSSLQAGFLSRFFKGWVGSEELPKDPSVYTPGWETLDAYQTHNHAEARAEFINDAHALGRKMRERWENGKKQA